MKSQSLLAVTLFAALGSTSAIERRYKNYPTKEEVNCRDEPKTGSKVVGTWKKGALIGVQCQTRGQNINGNNLWDFVISPNGRTMCWVSDYYVKTGSDGMVATDCSNFGP